MKWTRNLKGWKIDCWNWCGSMLTANSLNKTAAFGKSVLTQMCRIIWTVFQWRCDGEWSQRRKVNPQQQQQYHRIRNMKTTIGVTGIRPWNGWGYACLRSNDTLFHRTSRKYIQRTTQNNYLYNHNWRWRQHNPRELGAIKLLSTLDDLIQLTKQSKGRDGRRHMKNNMCGCLVRVHWYKYTGERLGWD